MPDREVIAFQVGSFWRSSVEALLLHIDVILVSHLVSLHQVGLYRAACRIVDAAKHPFHSISIGVQAEYSRQWYGGDIAAVRRISRRFTLLSLVIAVTGYGLLFMFHEPIIRIVLGPGFEEVAFPLLFLLPGALVFAVIAPVHILPAATGESRSPSGRVFGGAGGYGRRDIDAGPRVRGGGGGGGQLHRPGPFLRQFSSIHSLGIAPEL